MMHILIRNAALALIILAMASLTACGGKAPDAEEKFAELITARASDDGVSRADPGYMHYLERLSLYGNASRLAQMVSGSNYSWRRPASNPRPEDIIGRSNVWIAINPQTLQTPSRSSVLAHLSSPGLWSSLIEGGFTGLYLAPTGAGASLWDYDPERALGVSDDVIQYSFSKNIGTEQEYAQIIERSKATKILLGGDLVPAATGIGPDFFLAVRNMREYPGLYCMIEVPKHLWELLPPATTAVENWQISRLDGAQVERLSREKLFPRRMRQDALAPLLETGWAATSAVRGTDGNQRRWVYRYAYDYKRPILNFSDPSNAARQVMIGSAIYQSGVLGNSLNAYSLSPLIGLEPESTPPGSISNTTNFTLLMEISAELSRQSRTYGSHAWIKDELSLPLMREALQNGPDFVQDTLFSPAAEHALLTGDSAMLNFMADEGMNFEIDWTRLVHASTGHSGLSYYLPHLAYLAEQQPSYRLHQYRINRARELLELAPAQADEVASPKNSDDPPSLYEKQRLSTTPVGIAALALNLRKSAALTQENQAEIRRGHMLLQFFKMMQPGVYMPSTQDIVGAMPIEMVSLGDSRLADKRLAPMGSFPLLSSAEHGINSSMGLPRAKILYGSMDTQLYSATSFFRELSELLKIRQKLGIAEGQIIGRFIPSGQGVIALVTRLPYTNKLTSTEGVRSYAITVVNFNRKESGEFFDLMSIPELAAIAQKSKISLISGNFVNMQRQDNRLFMMVNGWAGGVILVESIGEI